MQRVYHVVFANTFHNSVALSRASDRCRNNVTAKRSISSLVFFELEFIEPDGVWPEVRLQLIEHRRRVASLSGNEGKQVIHRCG
jgi:hypothetical protein